MREPIRWVQTNLRENDAAMQPQKFIDELADMDGNAYRSSAASRPFIPAKCSITTSAPTFRKGTLP